MTEETKCPSCKMSLGSDGGCHYPYCADPKEASEVDRNVMPLNVKLIDILFKNVTKADDDRCYAYRVFDDVGNETGMISYLGQNEWRVYVDNFPSEKKYFAWNLPVKTYGQFVADIERTGLELIEA